MIISGNRAWVELQKIGSSISDPRDENLFCPSKEWLTEFGKWLYKNNPPYMNEKFDCDDFAIEALAQANRSLYYALDIKNCGHTFCYADGYINSTSIFKYIDTSASNHHAFNIVRLNDEKWYVFEPQTGEFDSWENVFKDDPAHATPYIENVWL